MRIQTYLMFILGFVFLMAGCSPPVVEDLRFQNVPVSTKMSGQATNGGTSVSVSPTFKVVNGVVSQNAGQASAASPSFRMTGGITYAPPQ